MAVKRISFEEAMTRLEEIVQALESGDEGLDQSLKLYEEGIGLVRTCTDRLERAEQTVKMLQMKTDGSITEVDFKAAGDAASD